MATSNRSGGLGGEKGVKEVARGKDNPLSRDQVLAT